MDLRRENKMKDLLEKIKDICRTNVDVDWSENDPSDEFAEILKLIEEETK